MDQLLQKSKSIISGNFLKKNSDSYSRDVRWIPAAQHLSLLGQYAGSRETGIGFLVLEMLDFHRIVLTGGDEKAFSLFDHLFQETRRMFARYFPECRCIFTEDYGMGESALFFEYPKRDSVQIARSYFSLRLEFDEMAEKETVRLLGQTADLRLGYSVIEPAEPQDVARCLIKGFCEARHFARIKPDEEFLIQHREFLGLLEEQSMRTVYQPILDFSAGDTLGWEAFARSPRDNQIYSSTALFRFAEHIGAVYALDQRCREMAIANLGNIKPDQLLFINTHHMFFQNELFPPQEAVRFLEDRGLKPENIVLEISEKQNLIDPVLLSKAMAPYCQLGFKVSIDNLDGGKSSLSFLFQIRPHFIKLDPAVVRGVDADPHKRLMVEVLMYLARKIETRVIALGVESENEFSSLVSLGVQAGQGFLFSGPEAETKERTIQVPTGASWPKVMDESRKCAKPVRDIAELPMTVSPDTKVEEVKERLNTRTPTSSVVVVDGSRPVGQVMSYELDRRLGTRYGYSLYLHRDVSHLMKDKPLLLEGDTPVEEAAKKAMSREGPQIYDDIILTENNTLLGTLSVQRLLDYMAEFQVELAKGSNPLTGLPGNLAIEHEIERRYKMRLPSSLIYLDLDNFKVYNDVYGFGKGDQVILMTAEIMKRAVKEVGSSQDFIGHVGGDDFVIISAHEVAEPLGQRIISYFEQEILAFYTEAHREAGFVVAVGRDGIRKEFQFVSLSIGILDFDFETEFTLSDLSDRAAEVKKYAKSIYGNSCVRERRSSLGIIQ